MEAQRMDCLRTGELIRRAWDWGIVYFQAYANEPDPAFYEAMPELLAHERVVAIPVPDPVAFFDRADWKGILPCFGAIAAGWVIGIAYDPADSGYILDMVAEARRQYVPPPNPQVTKHRDCGAIFLEGFGVYDGPGADEPPGGGAR